MKPMSRRDFIRDVAYTMAASAVVIARPWGTRSAFAQQANSFSALGIRPNADPAETFRKIQDALYRTRDFGLGPLYVDPVPPGKYYAINDKLEVPNGTELYGAGRVPDGSRSWIRNVVGEQPGFDTAVFDVGNYVSGDTGASFSNETWHNMNEVSLNAGQRTFYFTTPTAANDYHAGDVVALRSGQTVSEGASHASYQRQELNVVETSYPSSGAVVLKHGLSEAWGDRTLHMARLGGRQRDGRGRPVYARRNVTIRDMQLSQVTDAGTTAIFPWGGMIECKFLRLEVPHGTSFMSLNGMSRCLVDGAQPDGTRSTVQVGRKFFDIAVYSHHTTARNMNFYRLQNTHYEYTPVSHGEGGHDCTLQNMEVRLGSTSPYNGDNKRVQDGVFVGTARRSKLYNVDVYATQVPRDVVRISGSNEGGTCGVEVTSSYISAGNTREPDAGVEVAMRDSANSGVLINGNTFAGAPSAADVVIRGGSSGVTVKNNTGDTVLDQGTNNWVS